MPLIHWLQLSLTTGIGPILARRLIDQTGSAENACNATLAQIQNLEGVGTAKATKIHASLRSAINDAKEEIEKAKSAGSRIICADDREYPPLLRTITDPPLVLYVKGTLEPRDLHSIAIVGSRKCSHYGREQADRFGSLLAGAGLTVISGGARGIDSSAHHGAMMHPDGRTIAVLGCGVDVVYPPENTELFKQIEEHGAILSEYPIGTPPAAENFPKRNRIVSGMTRGTLVIEADERSGALITARTAGEDQGRTVFALPGRVDNPLSQGPHALIRDGAVLVTSLEHILEGLDPLPQDVLDDLPPEETKPAEISSSPPAPSVAAPAAPTNLSEPQMKIFDALGKEPRSVDLIVDSTGLEVSIILRELTLLSLKGLVKRVDGQSFARR